MEVKEDINSSREIKNGAIMSYITIIFNIVAGLIYTPWLVSKIGASDYGVFTLSISVIGLLVMDFGLGAAVSRYIAKYKSEGKYEKIKDFLGITFKLYLIIDIIIFLVLFVMFLCLNDIYVELTPIEMYKFKIIFGISAIFSVISFPFIPLNGILISNERFVVIKKCELLNKVGTMFFMVIALMFGGNVYALVIINVFVGLSLIIFKVKYIVKELNMNINFRCKDKKLLRDVFSFSAWTTIIGIAGRCIMNITPTILAMFSGADQIAVFAIGMSIEAYTYTFASALNGLFLPKISRMVTKESSKEDIENLMIKVGRIQLFMVGLLLVGFIILGRDFIELWIGDKFYNSYLVAVFLIIPCFITLTQEIANTMVIAVNKVKPRAKIYIITAIISVILSIFLSKEYGAIGSALAIGVALFIGNIVLVNIFYHKYLNIDIKKFFKECHLKMIIPLVISIVSGCLLQKYIPIISWKNLIFKICILTLIYIVLMWKISFNKFEKDLFSNTIKKIYIKVKSYILKCRL